MEITTELIKGIRKKFNLTQQQLADLIGVSRHTIQTWEIRKFKGMSGASLAKNLAKNILIILADEKRGPELIQMLKWSDKILKEE